MSSSEWNCIPCAFSGIAATLLPGGRTMHSRFGLPVPIPRQHAASNISMTTARAGLLRAADLILIDEAPNAPREAFNAIDELLRDVMSHDPVLRELPCGGKVVVMGGDFRQIPPVLRRATRAVVAVHNLRASAIWQSGVAVCRLHRNWRVEIDPSGDREWHDLLLEIGNGTRSRAPAGDQMCIQLPPEIVLPRGSSDTTLLDALYDDITVNSQLAAQRVTPPAASAYFRERAILCPYNDDVDRLNNMLLDRIDAPVHVFLSADSVVADDPRAERLYPIDFLNTVTPRVIPPPRSQ
eukprot:gene16564-biopygen35840